MHVHVLVLLYYWTLGLCTDTARTYQEASVVYGRPQWLIHFSIPLYLLQISSDKQEGETGTLYGVLGVCQ